MSDDDIGKAVRAWAEPHHLDRAHLERWLALDAYSAAAVLDAAGRLRLRVGQLQGALEMLAEIALVEKTQVSAVLARAPLKRILEGAGPAPARARAFVDELRAMRFPRLGRALDQMKAEVAALKLPRAITVTLPRTSAPMNCGLRFGRAAVRSSKRRCKRSRKKPTAWNGYSICLAARLEARNHAREFH